MKSTIYFLLSSVIVITSCVDSFDPKLKNNQERLVVESTLTSEFKHQFVFLTFDKGYNSHENIFKDVVINAKIMVEDDKGTIYKFIDDDNPSNQIGALPGYNYKSEIKFKVEVGRSYRLNIETINGNIYQSEFEKVISVPKIDRITNIFTAIPPPTDLKGYFDIFLNTQDEKGVKNYYKWDAWHVRQLQYCRHWYKLYPNSSRIDAFVDKCCESCYQIERIEDEYELGTDFLVDGNMITKKYITQVPFDNNTPYYIQINQYSLSENAYKFWSELQQQSKNSGGLFDTVPKSIKSNIRILNNPKSEVIGYFGVSDTHSLSLYIDRSNTNIKPILKTEYSDWYVRTEECYPCIESYKRSKTPPKGWIL